jgi:heptosyltransferase-2
MAPALLRSSGMKRRILIIKLGYCETLVNEQGFVPSLGDVFRHTILLHRYKNDEVTWLTSESALPLLRGNPYIAELLAYSDAAEAWLKTLEFDEVICLEKAPLLCQLADQIRAKRRYGFHWNGETAVAHPQAESTLAIANGRDHFLPIGALLYQMMNDHWAGEGYILGYQPKPAAQLDVGLNFRVGSKWPTKRWPDENWFELEHMLTGRGFSVSWQKGATDLEEYMDWIAGHRVIVTCDSLGMHLGLAMQKKVVALFGPTPADSIYMQNSGVILKANWSCLEMPCMKSNCERESECMKNLLPPMVLRSVCNFLSQEPAVEKFRSVLEREELLV